MVEPEAAFFDLEMNMTVAEIFVAYIVSNIIKSNGVDLELLGRDISKLEKITVPFPRITYDNAIEILNDNEYIINWGDDFGGDEETIISKHFDKPILIHRYPACLKPFYMKNDPDKHRGSP